MIEGHTIECHLREQVGGWCGLWYAGWYSQKGISGGVKWSSDSDTDHVRMSKSGQHRKLAIELFPFIAR